MWGQLFSLLRVSVFCSQVWDQIIHYSECTDEELRDVVLILLELLDGTSDVMQSSSPTLMRAGTFFSPSAARAKGKSAVPENRYEVSEFNLHIMECKLAVCNLLLVVLDLLASEELDKVCPGCRAVCPREAGA